MRPVAAAKGNDMRNIEKRSIEVHHDTGDRTVWIRGSTGLSKYRLEYNEDGIVEKVERNGNEGWKEAKPEEAKDIIAFWEAFQVLPNF
jgi:hypothetical protein